MTKTFGSYRDVEEVLAALRSGKIKCVQLGHDDDTVALRYVSGDQWCEDWQEGHPRGGGPSGTNMVSTNEAREHLLAWALIQII
jgi:hypothetical protein